MTSLIDVIFLLLLFFMLSSTFTRFAEVDLAAAGASSAGASSDRPVFVSLAAATLRLNGAEALMTDLSQALQEHRSGDGPLTVLVSLQSDVSAQRLTDLLATLRSLPDLRVTVLEST